jgi:flagellin
MALSTDSVIFTDNEFGNVTNATSSTSFATVEWETDGSGIKKGDYLSFSSPTTDYYAWFAGSGFNDPGIAGRTGIAVNFNFNDDAATLASEAQAAILAAASGSFNVTVSAPPYAFGIQIQNLARGAVTAPSTSGITDGMAFMQSTVGVNSAINVAADTISIASHGYSTGQALTLSSTGGLPVPLATSTTYYVIKVDANTIKLATSSANALAGTAINLTSQGGVGSTITLTPSGGGTQGTASTAYISNLDISSMSAARTSLTTLDTQMQTIYTTMGTIGASQSRLSSAVGAITAARDQFITAASRISDADVAQESASLVRSGMLKKSAAAVLAHANQLPALAVKLLT